MQVGRRIPLALAPGNSFARQQAGKVGQVGGHVVCAQELAATVCSGEGRGSCSRGGLHPFFTATGPR